MADYLRVQDLALEFGVSESTVRDWVFRRKIPFVKLGSAVRFKREDIEAWVESRKVGAEK